MADISIIVATNAKEVSNEIGGMANSLLASEKKAKQLAKAFKFLDASFNSGKIDAVKYSKAVQDLNKDETRLYSTLGKTTSALGQQSSALSGSAGQASKASIAAKRLADSQRMAGKSTNRFGMYSQQVGYQVGDMVVQIQGGTDALLAFGQQGTQLAGLLPGLAGAVLGIGLSLSTALGKAALQAKGLEVDFKGVINELKKPLQTIKPLLDGITTAFQFIGSASKTVLSTLANNLDRVVLYITVAASAFGIKLVAGLIAARVATFTLAGAFAFLRTAIIRTGIGAIIILVAEAIRMFMLLAKQVGGFGPLLVLLKGAFFEQLGKISLRFQWLGLMVKGAFWGIVKDALKALSDLLSKVNSAFVNKFIGMFAGAVAAAAEYIKSLPSIFVAVFQQIKKAVADGVNGFTGLIGVGINMLREKLSMEKIDFGNVIDTSGMTGGSVSDVLASAKAQISSAYQKATAIDYVTAAQNGLNSAINDASRAETVALKNAVSIDASFQRRGQATQALVDAYNSLPSGDQIDFDNMLKPAGGDDDGSGSLDKTLQEIELSKKLALAYGEEADRQRLILEIKDQLGDSVSKYTDAAIAAAADRIRAYEAEQEALRKADEQTQSIADTLQSSMSDAFMSMVDGTKSFKDAMKDMARAVIKQLYEVLVVQQLVGSFDKTTGAKSGIVGSIFSAFGFADGGAFSGGSQVKAYANGGVVGGPTYFPMSGGKTGLMGEAGPEAIMPLKRGANGKLGVQMEGSSGGDVVINQSFNFQANGDDSVKKLIAQAAPQIAQMTQKQIMDSRRRGGAMKSTFG